MFIVNYINFET